MKKIIINLLLVLVTLPGFAQKSDYVNNLSLEDRVTYHRAMEAVVYGIPMINMISMRDGLKKDAGVNVGDVAYNSQVQTWEAQFTTNNNTTPYSYIFWDLSDGPVVIEFPATTKDVGLVGTLMDTWQRTTIQVGNAGFDAGRGGKYFMMPPGYQGPQPEGYKAVQQKTNNGYTLLRPIIRGASKENLAKAVDFVKQIKVYPYGQEEATRYVDVYGKAIDGLPHFDITFFEKLHAIIQEEPIEEKDLAFMGTLRLLGIEKGKPFNPSSEMKVLLDNAAKEALTYLQNNYLDRSGELFYEGKQWSNAVPTLAFPSEMDWVYPTFLEYDQRGAGYYAYYTSFRKAGAGSFYLKVSRDQEGVRLNGSDSYTLHVEKDVPARNFWSVIAYTVDDATWFDNQNKSGVASTDNGVIKNADGSYDIYFGPKPPKGKEANWVPTNEGEEYFLYFRFYGPETPVLTGEWQLNDLIPTK